MKNNITTSTQLVSTEQIKSEISLFGIKDTRYDQYVYFERKDVYKKRILYFYSEQYIILHALDLDLNDIVAFLNKIDLPEKYLPKIKNITESSINHKTKKMRDNKLKKLIIKLKNEKNISNYYRSIIEKQKENIELLELFEVEEIKIDKALISILQQKDFDQYSDEDVELKNKIIKFLVELTKYNGVDFDTYIDNWANKLLNEFNMNI